MFVYTEHKCNMHAHRAQWTEAMSENKMQGWLKKESHDYFRAMRKWQWRYFILDFSTKRLSYYTDESLADQRGEYELDGSVLSEVRNYGRKKHRQHQIVVSGLKGKASSSLYVYSDCLEIINLWFAALRVVLQGEHPHVNEISVQMDEMRIAAQALKLRQSYDAGPGVAKASLSDPAHTLMLQTGSSSQEGSPAVKTRGMTLSGDLMEGQRGRQQRCHNLLIIQKQTFETIAQRITGRPYTNTDFEVSSVQLVAIEECLQIFRDVEGSIMLDQSAILNEFWLEILEMFIAALESTPQSMLHVHVRDMRYTITGLLDEAYREDPLEYNLVYDLSFESAGRTRILST